MHHREVLLGLGLDLLVRDAGLNMGRGVLRRSDGLREIVLRERTQGYVWDRRAFGVGFCGGWNFKGMNFKRKKRKSGMQENSYEN